MAGKVGGENSTAPHAINAIADASPKTPRIGMADAESPGAFADRNSKDVETNREPTAVTVEGLIARSEAEESPPIDLE